MSFVYRNAVVSRIPDSFAKDALRSKSSKEEVSLEKARRQHEVYIHTLRRLGLDVIELPADEGLPDCVFVEDTAVIHNGVALITRPGHPSRRKEVESIRRVLQKEFKLELYEIADENAMIDGGDVLFTGKEFFVGLSNRTNQAGALAVANAYPDYRVSSINVTNALHLKSLVSVAWPDVLAVGASPAAKKALKEMELKGEYDYEIITLPDDEAASCLYLNGTLIHCSKEEYPESFKVFEERMPDERRIPLNFSEISKVDAGLTCGVLLIGKQRVHIQ
ncbi:N(G),N(G)-dimethylarginine dimethylaminohydrolase 1-like isoform X2 [Ptychodera flava]